MVSVGLILHAVGARLSSLCGWLTFRLGLRGQARRHYERVLRLKGDDFSAYVHLGRLAYDAGDYAGWRREFEHARRADPVRFARLRHPFELFEPRLAGTTFEDAGERATWRSLRPFGAAQRVGGQHRGDTGLDDAGLRGSTSGLGSGDLSAGLGGRDELDASWPAAFDVPGPDPDPVRGAPQSGSRDSGSRDSGNQDINCQDDCSSPAERERFDVLGPIRRDEIDLCDLDDLADRFFD